MSAPAKILVAVDFSPESTTAIQHAMAVARRTGAELILMHACSIPDWPLPSGMPSQTMLKDYYARVKADVDADRARLEELRASLSGQGVTVSHVIADGFPDTTIVAAARDSHADLIVVGTHGRTGLRWLMLGSVAQRVIRLAEKNVLIARGAATAGGYQRICVATDFSPSSELALRHALEVAGKGARIDVVHFWSIPVRPGFTEGALLPDLSELQASLDQEIKVAGAKLLATHRSAEVDLRFESVLEPVQPGLIHRLEKGGHDLVAVGSHGRRGLPRFVMGSVAETVCKRSPCAVLVAHGPRS